MVQIISFSLFCLMCYSINDYLSLLSCFSLLFCFHCLISKSRKLIAGTPLMNRKMARASKAPRHPHLFLIATIKN